MLREGLVSKISRSVTVVCSSCWVATEPKFSRLPERQLVMEKYERLRELGRGSYGCAVLVRDRNTRQQRAKLRERERVSRLVLG